MITDELVKDVLTTWVILFGTRHVLASEIYDNLNSDELQGDNFWIHVVKEKHYIATSDVFNAEEGVSKRHWYITDAGIRHLQQESSGV